MNMPVGNLSVFSKLKSSLHLVLFPAVFLLCIPAYFIKLNIQDIERLDAAVVLILLVSALIITVGVALAVALFKWLYTNFILRLITEFVFFFIVVCIRMIPSGRIPKWLIY